MSLSRPQFIVIALLIFATGIAQPQSRMTSTATRSWPGFWKQFATAINTKNTNVLRQLMPEDFFDGGGGLTSSEWLQFINDNEKNGSWRDLKRSVARGTKILPQKKKSDVPTRITRDNGYYFEFRKNRWWFAGVSED